VFLILGIVCYSMYNMPNHCVITSHTNHCPLSSVTSLQGRSFLPWWVVDSISGELAASVFRIQALYPRCSYECPRNLPPHFSEQNSSAEIDLTFEGISFLFLRVMIILLLWLQTFRGTYFAPTFTFKVGHSAVADVHQSFESTRCFHFHTSF